MGQFLTGFTFSISTKNRHSKTVASISIANTTYTSSKDIQVMQFDMEKLHSIAEEIFHFLLITQLSIILPLVLNTLLLMST